MTAPDYEALFIEAQQAREASEIARNNAEGRAAALYNAAVAMLRAPGPTAREALREAVAFFEACRPPAPVGPVMIDDGPRPFTRAEFDALHARVEAAEARGRQHDLRLGVLEAGERKPKLPKGPRPDPSTPPGGEW